MKGKRESKKLLLLKRQMKGKKRVKKAPPSEKTLKKKVCQKGASFRKEEISMKRIVHAVYKEEWKEKE